MVSMENYMPETLSIESGIPNALQFALLSCAVCQELIALDGFAHVA
jgi:hypothetical protein